LEAVFEPTLNMITKDFTEFPEHRVGFFKLLRAINLYCFEGMTLRFDFEQINLYLFKLFWVFRHPDSNFSWIALSGPSNTLCATLQTWVLVVRCWWRFGLFSLTNFSSCPVCTDVVDNFSHQAPEISNGFYQQYYLSVLQDIFWVVTDADHKSGTYGRVAITFLSTEGLPGFRLQSYLLARMFELVETGQVQLPLFDPATVSDPNTSNSEFLREYCVKLLQSAFTHLQL
jgi:exportin-1